MFYIDMFMWMLVLCCIMPPNSPHHSFSFLKASDDTSLYLVCAKAVKKHVSSIVSYNPEPLGALAI